MRDPFSLSFSFRDQIDTHSPGKWAKLFWPARNFSFPKLCVVACFFDEKENGMDLESGRALPQGLGEGEEKAVLFADPGRLLSLTNGHFHPSPSNNDVEGLFFFSQTLFSDREREDPRIVVAKERPPVTHAARRPWYEAGTE